MNEIPKPPCKYILKQFKNENDLQKYVGVTQNIPHYIDILSVS